MDKNHARHDQNDFFDALQKKRQNIPEHPPKIHYYELKDDDAVACLGKLPTYSVQSVLPLRFSELALDLVPLRRVFPFQPLPLFELPLVERGSSEARSAEADPSLPAPSKVGPSSEDHVRAYHFRPASVPFPVLPAGFDEVRALAFVLP